MKRHVSRYFFPIVVLIILVVPIIASFGFNNNAVDLQKGQVKQKSEANSSTESGWLTGWMNRKSHQIQGVTGAGTNYQVKLIVNYGSGTDSDNNVYTDSKCQPDFDDIRFTDDDGFTLLDYWLETSYPSANATFWVEVRDSLDFNQNIYVYYGNPNASDASDGESTFLVWDDFDLGYAVGDEPKSSRGWFITDNGTTDILEIAPNPTGKGGNGLRYVNVETLTPGMMLQNTWDQQLSIAIHMKLYWDVRDGQFRFNVLDIDDEDSSVATWSERQFSYNLRYRDSPTSYLYYSPMYELLEDVWYSIESQCESDAHSLIVNNTTLSGDVRTAGDGYDHIYIYGHEDYLDDFYIDDFFIRKWVPSEPAHGAWSEPEPWLNGWNYRKTHEITGSIGAGENYQIQIVVHYGNGTDSGADVYCEERCQTDFDDIRFTDNDGYTLLDYWIECVSESDIATFWVEVKDDLDSDATICIYYGNSTVTNLSNGTATFIFFDDFEAGSFNPAKWYDVGDWEIVSSNVKHGSYAAHCEGGVAYQTLRSNVTSLNLNYGFLYHVWAMFAGTAGSAGYPVLMREASGESLDNNIYSVMVYNGQYCHSTNVGGPISWPSNSSVSTSTYYRTEVGFDIDLGTQYGWRSDDYMGTSLLKNAAGNNFSQITYLFPNSGSHPGQDMWIDDFYLRKWIPVEPTHGQWDEPTQFSWYHDCSNTTGFVYNDEWNMNWTPWDIQNGTLTSDGSVLSVTYVVTGTGWHGPVFEYELPQTFRVRDIDSFAAFLHADNSLNAYVGYEVLMLGDSNRNPVIFFSFHDGWAGSCQGSFGVAYVFTDGSYVGYGSGYPVGWTSFNGIMNASYTEAGLLAHVDGFGEGILPGLTEADFDREIKYITVASARYGSDPLIPVLIDEISINCESLSGPLQPCINDVEDFEYETGTSGNIISWTTSNFIPTSYELYRDGGLLTSDLWPGGTQLEISVDNLAPGEYNYTLVVFGGSGITVSDTVIVTVVDTTVPSLGHPVNIIYEYGTTGHSIYWSVSDLYPNICVFYKDGGIINAYEWTSGLLTLNIDGLALGQYDYSIVVNDTSGNSAFDSVTVMVVDTTAPILDHPSDGLLYLGSTKIQINWHPTDLLPFNYEVYQNSSLVSNGTWISGENLTYITEEGLAAGSYNITIIVWDTSGNYVIDTVFVSISAGSIPYIGEYLGIGISIGSIVIIVVVVVLLLRNHGSSPSAGADIYNW